MRIISRFVLDNMADENVPAPTPTRSDDQILPFAVWVPIGKSNYLDENWFTLDANLLREALEITPIDQAHKFVSPPSGDAIMYFVNELGYTEVIQFVSRMVVNNLYQPWRSILSMINQCLTGKTSGPTKKGRKDKPHVIPYCRFMKLIICHLGRTHNIHQRSASLFHLVEEDLKLGNLKFVPKGEEDEGEKKKPTTSKQPKPKPAKEKSSKPAPAPKPKVTKESPSKPSSTKHPKKGKVQKIRKGKPSLQLIDEDKPTQPEPEPEHQEPVAEATRPLLVVEGKGKAITTKEQAAQSLLALHTPKRRSTTEEASTGPSTQPQDEASANIVRESPYPADAETSVDTDKTNSGGDTEILQIGEEQSDDVANLVNLEEKTVEIDEGQAGSNLGKTPKSRPPPNDDKMDEDQAGPDPRESHVALYGPNPEPTHDEFIDNVYPNVHESLKFPADEHVILEDPLSLTGTLSSMKNLDDVFTIGDQFINDKSTKDESEKLNVKVEVVSMATGLIYQASSLSKTLDNTTHNLGSRVFTLELRDLLHKINQTANEVVKEVVHVALQAPLRDRFRELPEADMKEILHQRMFETGTYKSLPEHVALYEALEASMEQANMDEFFAEKDKSRKRRRDDQEPPPPPPDSDLSKKKRHDSDASSSSQPPAPQSSAWKTTNAREAPSSSSKQQFEDTNYAYLPKIKSRPEWLKPILEEDRPTTPEPDWSIPMNDLPEPENNWANALGKSYKDPKENKLLQKTGDIGAFITWFCKRIGKKKLSKSDLEGPAFKLVPDVNKPLPLGGPPGQVTIQPQFFFNKDLEYLVSGDKDRRSALSISKLKATQYLDIGLEELVMSLWIESEREYDISAAYGISHWWFKRKEFYITRHSAPSDRSKVRSHMRILNVVSLKTLKRYGYTYLKEIVLCRADNKEYKISKADFKNLHPNDFEDLYLLHL
ncbi:hypothetical protein Tco_0954828 [Tanacetum coccineum]|uniref:Uncharacterized protein n=1 Tax=Tanacetum coccineum TaxID=301880 RepID=A0ABQ5E5G6_9ASTR